VRMLDLFCGRWGWSRAFAARGWECVGVDLIEPPEIPDGCIFFRKNVLDIDYRWIRGLNPDFVCISSPCNQFTMFQLQCFHKDPPYPSEGIELFNHSRELCEMTSISYVQENVRAAQEFVGRAVNHCGPFYLWGTAVPPILPRGITKGFGKMDRQFIISIGSSKSKKRAEHRAKVATIPPELSSCVADYAERLIEMRQTA